MIGNDIIDLQLAATESNWQRRGFLQKIFTRHEQLLIAQSDAPEIAVWDLWSRKEAAYKIFNRETGIRKFMPLRLECADLNPISKVFCDGRYYFTKTKITAEYIETTAVAAKNLFKNTVQQNADKIVKINSLPFAIHAKTNVPASVSHHGRFYSAVSLNLFDSEPGF